MAPKAKAKTSWLRQLVVAIVALFILYVGISAIYRNLTRDNNPGVKLVGVVQTPEQLQEAWCQDWLKVLQEVVALLETIKDEATAKAAAPRLEEYTKVIEQLAVRQKSLTLVSGKEYNRIMNKFMPEMEKVQKSMQVISPTLPDKINDEESFTEAWNKVLEAVGKLKTK